MIKLIISLLFFLLISCEQISKEEVISTIENTKDTIVEKLQREILAEKPRVTRFPILWE